MVWSNHKGINLVHNTCNWYDFLDIMEQTYVMIKPDGVQRGLVGRVIQKFEEKGLQLVGLRLR
jgi:hypothetical protein